MKRFLLAAMAASMICCGAGGAQAALIDGTYRITGVFDDPRYVLSGSFGIVGGAVQDLLVTTDYLPFPFGVSAAVYVGPGVNEATGTMFSATLSLANISPFATGSGFLSLSTDGRFVCGGVDFSSFTNTCQVRSQVFGTEPDEKVGAYQIERIAAAVPLPAGLPLLVGALAGLGLLRCRRS